MSGPGDDQRTEEELARAAAEARGKTLDEGGGSGQGAEDEEGYITMERDVCPAFEALTFFDIRNGDEEEARSMLMKPTIAKAYHWPIINGLPADKAYFAMGAFIRSAYAQVSSHSPASMTHETKLKIATALGVVRCVATAQYRLEGVDFIPGELVDSYISVKKVEGNELRFRHKRTADPHVAAAMRLDLTDVLSDSHIISALTLSGLGVLPNQGYSLIMCNHHYLSDPASQSRKAYIVMERQFWKSTDVATWFDSDLALLQDVIWHKSTHPVNISLKTTLATDKRIAKMLKAAGAGSAASRLPAAESVVRSANSYRTLMATVGPLFMTFGGSIDYTTLDNAIEVVTAYPVDPRPGFQNPVFSQDMRVPPLVRDRKSALDWLSSIVDRNTDTAAFCYGFYTQLTESTAMLGASAGNNSLKSSFSLQKLPNVSHAAYIAGTQAHQDYAAAKAQLRMAGKFMAPRFVVS